MCSIFILLTQAKDYAENLYRVKRPTFLTTYRNRHFDSELNYIADDWLDRAQFNKSTNLLNIQLRQRTRYEFLVKNVIFAWLPRNNEGRRYFYNRTFSNYTLRFGFSLSQIER